MTRAWDWAKNHGPTKHRVNAIHGEEEIRIILSDTFEHEELGIEENTRTGTMEVEEPLGMVSECIPHPPYVHKCKACFPQSSARPDLKEFQDEHGTLLETDLPAMEELATDAAPPTELPSTSGVLSFKFLE